VAFDRCSGDLGPSLGTVEVEHATPGTGQQVEATTAQLGLDASREPAGAFDDDGKGAHHGAHASAARGGHPRPRGGWHRKLPVGNMTDRQKVGTTSKGRDMGIERIGVVGSGIMGSGIAEVAATTGHEVVLRSRKLESAQAMRAALEKSLARQVEKGRREQADAEAALARVTATADLADLADCDLVIESVVEDLEVKKQLFADLDGIVAEGAILATNTSTLPVVEMAVVTGRPDRVCGVHFFNPAPAMSLVEIVRPLTASDDTIAAVTAFATACGKSPVEVADRAGFIVNALLFPYLNNAVRMLENGVASRDAIDTAMKGGCNFPMGPLALLDLVGLDTSVAILDALYDEFRDPNYAPVPVLRRMVSAGQLGRKSGLGFYDYAK
jgi:3-hydroxybutyryl-CoA dehydrogenase